MSRRPSWSYLVPHLLRSLFRRRQTIGYPVGPLELNPRYRGRIELDIVKCVGCGQCAVDCPTGGLTVRRLVGGGVQVVLNHDQCASCGLCEESCSTGAIRQVPRFVPAATRRAAMCTEWTKPGRAEGGDS